MESDTGNSDDSFIYNMSICFNTCSAISGYIVFSGVAFILEAVMANDEKDYFGELEKTGDLLESPYETEEQIVEVDDSILEEGVISKTIKSSSPQPDGSVKTVIKKIYAQDRLARCNKCRILFPRRKLGVYGNHYYCKKDFPYTRYYFKRFFGKKGAENATRTQRESAVADGFSERSRSGNEPTSSTDDKELSKTIQLDKGNAPGEISHA